ncbi:MAG: winged helix-turn-helix domain-containing protein [Alphaproteobacteria bacterium]|nr:winged helix-turn-helix domain-containing protein [Alphaproteobacteria bacterium]
MSAPASPKDNGGTIDLGREVDFLLGGLRIHPSTCEVAAGDRREIVQPRAMQVLVALARGNGAVVSRDQLIQLCWEGRVIGEDAINRAIAKVRAVADLTDPPAFEVETIPRVGFRLKVSPTAEAASDPASRPLIPAGADEKPSVAANWIRSRAAVMLAVALATTIIAALFFWQRNPISQQQLARKPAEASIAVLPFVNMSGDPAKDYFSDGFSEELLNDLANTPQLRVAARTSSFAFKGKRADIRDIARKLNVRMVLEGSVRESGNHIRITAQLIDAGSGFHVWSQAYDRDLGDMLRVQDEISRSIAAALSLRLASAEGNATIARIKPDAYRKFLQGKFYFDRRTDPDNRLAIGLLREATALQPDFAEAQAMLAYAYLQSLRARLASPPRQEFERLQSSLQTALRLDPENVTALYVSLHLSLQRQEWNAAGEFVRRLSSVSPAHPLTARARGFYHAALGFPDRALASWELATRLDPLSPAAWQTLIVTLMAAGKNREAIETGETAVGLKLEGAYLRGFLCTAYAQGGRLDSAKKMETQIANTADRASLLYCRFVIALVSRDFARAHAMADTIASEAGSLNLDAQSIAENYIGLGDRTTALAWINRAYEADDYGLYSLPYDKELPRSFFQTTEWKELTQRPRFRAWQAAHDKLAGELKMQHQ